FLGGGVGAWPPTHPGVGEGRVFAREHPPPGEVPVAGVVPADAAAPPAAQELSAHCRAALPGYKVPREFRMVEALPRTATGKLARTPGEPAPSAGPPAPR